MTASLVDIDVVLRATRRLLEDAGQQPSRLIVSPSVHGLVFHLAGQHNQKLHAGNLGVGPLGTIDLAKARDIPTRMKKAEFEQALVGAGVDADFIKGKTAKEQYEVLMSLKRTTPEDLEKARGKAGDESDLKTDDATFKTDHVDESFDDAGNAWARSLTDEEWAATAGYRNGSYASMNEVLRFGSSELEDELTKTHIKNLDTALEKGSLPESRMLYRGASENPKNLVVGNTFNDAGFGSTTVNPVAGAVYARKAARLQKYGEIPEGHAAVMYSIRAKKGTKGGYVGSTGTSPDKRTSTSRWNESEKVQAEDEFIFPRGVQYRVTGVMKPDDEYKYWRVDLEIDAVEPPPLGFAEDAKPRFRYPDDWQSDDYRTRRMIWAPGDVTWETIRQATEPTGRIFHLAGQHNQKLHAGGGNLGLGPLDNVDLDKLQAVSTKGTKASYKAGLIGAGLDPTFVENMTAVEMYETLKAGKKTTSEDLAVAKAALAPKAVHPTGGDISNVDYDKVAAIKTKINKTDLHDQLVDAGVNPENLKDLTAVEQYNLMKDLKKGSPAGTVQMLPQPDGVPKLDKTLPVNHPSNLATASANASATYVQNNKAVKNMNLNDVGKAAPGTALDVTAGNALLQAGVDKDWVAAATPLEKAELIFDMQDGKYGKTSWNPSDLSALKNPASHSSAPGVDMYGIKNMTVTGMSPDVLKAQLAKVGVDKTWLANADPAQVGVVAHWLKGQPASGASNGLGIPTSAAAHAPSLPSWTPPAGFNASGTPGKLTGATTAWKANLSYDEKKAIGEYTNGTYVVLNDAFRTKTTLSAKYAKKANDLDSALSKAALPEDRILYRGSYLTDNQLKLGVGSVLTDKGYGSSSINQSVAKNFTKKHSSKHGKVNPTVFRIQAKKGTPAGYVAHGLSSVGKNEAEVVLPRGARYKVVGITPPKLADWGNPLAGVWVADVELVDFDPD